MLLSHGRAALSWSSTVSHPSACLARLRRLGKAASRCITTEASKQDVLLRSLSGTGEISVLVVDGTNLVAEAARRHQTAPTATAALGRALLGTLLMGSFRKDDEMIQVNFRGDGPLGGILAVADTRGNVKGKVGDPSADPPLQPNGKMDVAAAVGSGVLAVVRSHPKEPRPYTGMIPIVSGEVAEDLANYLADSEQTNTALGLGVSVARDCSVKAAGGFMVQVLPFCSEETLQALEKNLSTLPALSEMLGSGMTTQDITNRILHGIGVAPDAETLTPQYGPCDPAELKQRMIRAVAMLGEEEVKSIAKEQGKIEVSCDFCCEQCQFSEADLMTEIERLANERHHPELQDSPDRMG